ncbi:MAG: EamA family transporter [Elusimicrobia bacterium]|nr:EamA family transporter [Elusimicrobiota bacterium]
MSSNSIIFLVLCVLCWSAGAVLDKISVTRAPANLAFFARVVAVIVMFVPIALWKWLSIKSITMGLDKTTFFIVVASAAAANLGVYFFLKAMQGGEASKVVPLTSAYPLVAFIFALLILGEKFTWLKLTGTLLISAGVACLAM